MFTKKINRNDQAEQVHAHPSPLNDRSLQQGFDNAICANRGAPPQSEM
jgi:hypothetical protein